MEERLNILNLVLEVSPMGTIVLGAGEGKKKKPTLLTDSEVADQEAKTTEILEELKRK